jgi:polyisoprenoid-binding protein YceI
MAVLIGPAAAPAATWLVDPAQSKLGFKGAMAGEAFTGVFRRWSAQIVFDAKALGASKATVMVETGSAATGDADRDQAMPTADWFSAKAFPRATFSTTAFKDLGHGRYQAVGELTIKGVKRPLVLPFTLDIAGDTARMNGTAQLDRTDFGVGAGRWSNGAMVATAVTLNVAITARRGR